jgi:hypothetical protein
MLTTQYFSCLVHFLAWYDEEVERCPHTFLTAMYKCEHSVFFGVHMKKSLSVQITLNKLFLFVVCTPTMKTTMVKSDFGSYFLIGHAMVKHLPQFIYLEFDEETGPGGRFYL